MNRYIFLIIMSVSFSFLMTAIGYGVIERPDVFLPAMIIFSFLCATVNTND